MYGTAKNETVPTSNKNPIIKVFAILKKDKSTSLKTQIVKMMRTKNETNKKNIK